MIEASFEGGRDRSAAVSGAYQYDTGQRLRLYGLPSPTAMLEDDELLSGEAVTVQAQFSFVGDSQTERRMAQYEEESGTWIAAVPDVYLTQSRDVHVYIYVSYGETQDAYRAKTCYEAAFRPLSRPAPGNAVTPNQLNEWGALVQEINLTLATANTSISEANAAAILAGEKAESAQAAAQNADSAAQAASGAAQSCQAEGDAWRNAQVQAVTLEPGAQASVSLTQEGGAKKLTYGIPRGQDGEKGDKGDKGDTGPAGVTFTLSGTTLYIDTV